MTINTIAVMKRGVMGLAAGAFSLGLAAIPAHAQDDGYYDNGYAPASSYDDNSRYVDEEGLTVTAPRHLGRSAIGADIDLVSASRTVRYDDLDVDTGYGAHVLKARIERAARDACDQLDRDYPYDADNGARDCYADAVRHGLHDAAYQIGYTPGDW
ncbi:UrcA family protein [Caulobacter sp. KR2-114]|uniref:UrcA family protein n=1 Tax=Caulobacter sp. KR2-114 TaxID=3400912 RepID=UPI003C0B28D7